MLHRLGRLGLFLVVALPLVGGSHLYFARRLVLDPGFAPVFAWAIAALGALVLTAPYARRRVAPAMVPWITLPATFWLGIAFLLLVVLSASDLAAALLGILVPSAEAASRVALVDSRTHAFGVLALTSLAGGVGLVSALRTPAVRRQLFLIERWPSGLDDFRIVQLSDLHVGPLRGRSFVASIVERCNSLEPDLVVVTGDLVDGSVAALGDEVSPFATLRARYGVFFVTGNHEYFSKADAWIRRFTELGMRPLRNEHVPIGDEAAGFDLAGVDDRYARHFGGDHGENLEQALQAHDSRRPVVLLAHNPTVFDRAAERGVDLQISGHTHGGQIWPFGWIVRLVVPYVAGAYRKGRSQLYVSRGTGFWGPPLRLFAPAEITWIALRRGTPAEAAEEHE